MIYTLKDRGDIKAITFFKRLTFIFENAHSKATAAKSMNGDVYFIKNFSANRFQEDLSGNRSIANLDSHVTAMHAKYTAKDRNTESFLIRTPNFFM